MAGPARLPKGKLILFSMGQFGWSLCTWAVANALNYFFLPPEDASRQAAFPPFIFQGAVFVLFTLIGIISMGGRVFDALIDPLVANLSDRSKSRFGRRRLFMAISFVPMAVLSFLVFMPIAAPGAAGWAANAAWLVATLTLFYWFFSMYCTPFNALIAELGHDSNERLGMATAVSVTWALGFAVGSQTYAFQAMLEKSLGLPPEQAFQLVIGGFAALAAVCMALPVLFVDENKYAEKHSSDEGTFRAVASAFKYRNFRTFVLADLFYWIAMNFIQIGITYYVFTLLPVWKDQAEAKEFTSFLLIVMFALSFVLYLPVNILAKKFGKKPLLVAAFVVLGLVFALVSLFGVLPLPERAQAWIVIVAAAVPIAIFGILPTALVADSAEAYAIETGQHKAGIFFGARTAVMKMGQAFSNLIFSSFLLAGKTVDNPLGIRITAVVAVVFAALGLLVFSRFDEKALRASLAKKEG